MPIWRKLDGKILRKANGKIAQSDFAPCRTFTLESFDPIPDCYPVVILGVTYYLANGYGPTGGESGGLVSSGTWTFNMLLEGDLTGLLHEAGDCSDVSVTGYSGGPLSISFTITYSAGVFTATGTMDGSTKFSGSSAPGGLTINNTLLAGGTLTVGCI